MTPPPLSLIESIAKLRGSLQSEPRTLARLQALQRWQVQRLEHTYADYYAQPRYRDAILFFVNDLYGPHDDTQRDRDLHRVLEPWQRLLPQRALHAVSAALELEALSLRLDVALLDALADADINTDSYAQAYRAVNRHDDRQRQIMLIVTCGHALDALVNNPWVRRALRVAAVPARLTGVMALHEFLERGYAAFVNMGGALELLNAIEQRESEIMDNLFSGARDPFRISEPHTHAFASAAI